MKAQHNQGGEAQPKRSAEIHSIGAFQEIPPSDLPLQEVGARVYREWCERLLRMGNLTPKTRETIESLAVLKDAISMRLAAGKPPTSRDHEMLRALLMKMEKFDADIPIQTGQGHSSPYARLGFAKRARAGRHDGD